MLERFLRSPLVPIIILVGLGGAFVVKQEHLQYRPLITWPLFTFIIIYFLLIVIHNRRNKDRKIKLYTFVPYELREEDEGMQWITFKACRKIYIFYYFAIPVGILLAVFFAESVPYFTIWLLV